jgi:hypothetical protein
MSHKTAATVARTIGIDTGKNTLHLIGLDDKGAIVLREKIARGRIAARLANVPRCLIGIEAGMATHYVARELIALGHDVRQVPPAYSKPFRQMTAVGPFSTETGCPRDVWFTPDSDRIADIMDLQLRVTIELMRRGKKHLIRQRRRRARAASGERRGQATVQFSD